MELAEGQKERVKLLEKNESDRGRGEGRGGTFGGEKASVAICLCANSLVTVATSKKSLSLIYTVAGSGVFNCIISFFLSAVTHPSLAAVLHFILGLFTLFFSPMSSFLLVCRVPFF